MQVRPIDILRKLERLLMVSRLGMQLTHITRTTTTNIMIQ
jgi:hypothetical protein